MEGIGLSTVEIARMKTALDRRPSWVWKWFSPEEKERAIGRARIEEELAGRYACKMAVRRALIGHMPHGFRIPLQAIVTSNDPKGKPLVYLTDEYAQLAEGRFVFHVSITHSRDLAAAIAVLSVRR